MEAGVSGGVVVVVLRRGDSIFCLCIVIFVGVLV